MPILATIVLDLSFEVLPITIYLLVVQTRAMRVQTTALVEQSKEMTAQTRVFIDTIYSATFQSLYDAEAHIGELMMTYPEASRILMSPMPPPTEGGEQHRPLDPEVRERVRWLGTAMLDFFEHIWTQSQKGGLPKDVWEAWEDYMGKMVMNPTHKCGGLCLVSTATRKGDPSALASPTDTSGTVVPGQHDKLPVLIRNLLDEQRSHMCAVLPWPRVHLGTTHQEPLLPRRAGLQPSLSGSVTLAPNRIVNRSSMGALVGKYPTPECLST